MSYNTESGGLHRGAIPHSAAAAFSQTSWLPSGEVGLVLHYPLLLRNLPEGCLRLRDQLWDLAEGCLQLRQPQQEPCRVGATGKFYTRLFNRGKFILRLFSVFLLSHLWRYPCRLSLWPPHSPSFIFFLLPLFSEDGEQGLGSRLFVGLIITSEQLCQKYLLLLIPHLHRLNLCHVPKAVL